MFLQRIFCFHMILIFRLNTNRVSDLLLSNFDIRRIEVGALLLFLTKYQRAGLACKILKDANKTGEKKKGNRVGWRETHSNPKLRTKMYESLHLNKHQKYSLYYIIIFYRHVKKHYLLIIL